MRPLTLPDLLRTATYRRRRSVPKTSVIETARYAHSMRCADSPVEQASTPARAVTVEDLRRFADTFSDLANVDLMTQAWE